MRFNYGRLGEQPAAGLIGAAITNPIDLTASLGSYLQSDDSSTFYSPEPGSNLPVVRETNDSIDSSVSYGRMEAREAYNEKLLGPNSPSWTHASIGQNQSYVIGALSSSRHEETNLNLQTVGGAFKTKKVGLQTYVAKRTASLNDLVPGKEPTYRDVLASDGYPQQTGPGVVYPACSIFIPSSGTLCEITGSQFRDFGWDCETFIASPHAPAIFDINVPVSGRLVDIKVWVELHHSSGTMSGTVFEPLSSMAISLRSPNVNFRSALPIENDPKFIRWGSGSVHNFSYLGVGLLDDGMPHRLYSSAYLLWDGAACGCATAIDLAQIQSLPDLSGTHLGYLDRARYPTFNTDRSMRVVFSDGASIPNPRHLVDGVSVSGNFIGSPSHGAGIQSAWGAETWWVADTGSPPKGWLSGPGGTAAENEWPTTGSNNGAIEIRPVYPLLDDVYEVKRVGSDTTYGNANPPGPEDTIFETEYGHGYTRGASPTFTLTAAQLFNDARNWRGFRPGLRGTEISGTWRLNIAAYPFPLPGQSPNDSYGAGTPRLYFRQARLEITYESWKGSAVRSSSAITPGRPGPKLISLISGSSTMRAFNPTFLPSSSASFFGPGGNYFINEVYTDIPAQAGIGRTFGVTANTGTFREDNYALLYRLTGSLADISGSVPSWLFAAPGGMPQIPESSASLVPIPVESTPPRTNDFVTEAASPPKILRDASYEFRPPLKRTQIAHLFVSSSTR